MRVNPLAVTQAISVGDFQIVVVDDFYEDVDAVRDRALEADYSPAASFYPGLHSPVHDAESLDMVRRVCGIMEAFDWQFTPEQVRVDFSVITTPAEKLTARQHHPHIDPAPLFGLIYLSTWPTGTSFYRNLILGTHRVATADDEERYRRFRDEHLRGRDFEGYDLSSSPHWELMYRVEGRYNRMVCYPGNVFHAAEPGRVPVPFDLGRARITQRIVFGQRPREFLRGQ